MFVDCKSESVSGGDILMYVVVVKKLLRKTCYPIISLLGLETNLTSFALKLAVVPLLLEASKILQNIDFTDCCTPYNDDGSEKPF